MTNASSVTFDASEHFVKMGYRNRFYITGGNGRILLTVPLLHGRDQRTPMKDVLIDNKERWQVQHRRTITSVYGRAPYFEHYALSMQSLFTDRYERLVDFNHASIEWLKAETGILFNVQVTNEYKQYDDDIITDLRSTFKPGIEKSPIDATDGLYYQLFAERNGFYPNLSMLDMLFCEGPAVKSILKQYGELVAHWQTDV